MRAAVPGLANPYPMLRYLPEVFHTDQVTAQWTAALDDVLAPMVSTIDCVHGYLDPLLAPEDFVRWLAGWFGVLLDESWPVSAQRAVIADAVELYRLRGTMAGLRRHLDVVVDGTVSIEESGGTSVSVRPRPEPPANLRHWVHVTVRPRLPISSEAVEAVIRAAKPVHVTHTLEVITP